MKDFNLAKYLRENYQGPFSMFQPYTDLNPLKEESEEQLDTEIPYKGPDPHLDGMGSDFEQAEPVEEGDLNEDATMTFDMNDPEASEDALEWILDNISDTEDVVKSEEEALQFRIGSIEDMVGTMNTRLRNSMISYDEFRDGYDEYIKLTIQNAPRIKEEVGAEQEKYDRMMGLIDTTLEDKLSLIKNAVDAARKKGLTDKAIFTMLSTSPITQQSVQNLVDDGFDPLDIVDFFATDFTIAEDGDNVTMADNEAYSAGMEEEVTVSSSGVEM